jgi:translation initiation factor 1 (eIF-1/SUI1)
MFKSDFQEIKDLENNNKINLDQIKLIDLPFRRKKRTLIENCFNSDLAKKLKRKLGCGGNISKLGIELQGDFVTNHKLKKLLNFEELLT